MEVQSRPEFVTGLRVARYAGSIVRSASAADLLAAAEATSRLITQSAIAAAASRPHGVARVNGAPDNLAIPFYQWEEQTNRRLVDLAGINTTPRNPPANTNASNARNAAGDQAKAIAYAVTRTANIATNANAARLGIAGTSYTPPVLSRIHEIQVYRNYGPAGNLVDVMA